MGQIRKGTTGGPQDELKKIPGAAWRRMSVGAVMLGDRRPARRLLQTSTDR